MNYIIVSMSLSKEKIILNLSPASCISIGEISCFEQIDSTNRWLLDQARQKNVHHHVCVAKSQSAGVGRNGKPWFGGSSDNILMSVAHEFDMPMARLSGLSLVVGIAIVDALESFGVNNLFLKWPNDVYLNGNKLAGILIQTQSSAEKKQSAIVGIGLNIRIDDKDKKTIGQPVAQLSKLGFNVDQRELIIAAIINQLFKVFEQFTQTGLDSYLERWHKLDHLKDQDVQLTQGSEKIIGKYLGINRYGSIRITLQNNQINEYYAGELSIRAVN